MNAAVITTGPEVIIATATASRNCRSVSQCWPFTTPPVQEWNDLRYVVGQIAMPANFLMEFRCSPWLRAGDP